MQGLDKWPESLQWAIGFGAFLGGVLMAWFGSRSKRHDDDDELAQARDKLRDAELRQEISAVIADAKDAMATALSATRQSFYDEFNKLRESIDRRLGELERKSDVIESQVENLQRHRPR